MGMLQLALLVIAIGVLILSIRIVRGSAKDDLARPLKFLHWGFWGCVLSFVLALGADQLFVASDGATLPPSVISNLFLAAFYVFGCFYWTSLGVLAHRIGRSWVIWIVAGLAALALGFIVSYVLMASRARLELTQREGRRATEHPATD